jgi:choline dehydrogenase-like flavoprotein
MNRRLYIANGTQSFLQLDIEQIPNANNRVWLTNSQDQTGRYQAALSWSVTSADQEAIRVAAQRFIGRWPSGDGWFPELLSTEESAGAPKPHDVYHPVGTCRMGTDSEAVVDPEMRANGTSNLWVTSTAIFPSAGTANPTFSLLCLTDALADTLTELSHRRAASA